MFWPMRTSFISICVDLSTIMSQIMEFPKATVSNRQIERTVNAADDDDEHERAETS